MPRLVPSHPCRGGIAHLSLIETAYQGLCADDRSWGRHNGLGGRFNVGGLEQVCVRLFWLRFLSLAELNREFSDLGPR